MRAPQRVHLKRKTIEAYRPVVGDDEVARLRDLAQPLRGLRLLELSSTATGGGVAEMLASLVPLERDLAIEAEWHVIAGDRRFFEVTKKLHNGMQGMSVDISDPALDEYLRHNERAAETLGLDWDVVVVHDPQPAAVRSFAAPDRTRWIWRCHIDSSTPDEVVWRFLHEHLRGYDHAVFTVGDFVPPDLEIPVSLIAPAIDPLTSKNRLLPGYLARETAAELGIDLSRPLLLQVSRFDPWKDPLGVIEVWRRLGDDFPELQLALVGAMASDDPEAWRVYRTIEAETQDDGDCFLLTSQMGVAAHEVNALQRVADVAIQKSVREGFGLIVSETLWKGTAMVAGRAGGIPLQLEDGVSGRLADSIEDFVGAVAGLLEDPVQARQLGVAGAERVRERFLIPRLLGDQLDLLRQVVPGGPAPARAASPDGRESPRSRATG